MNIAILSGKGGTGKTTVSVNLASIAGSNTALLDCDVEEPNSHLFISSGPEIREQVYALYPEIDDKLCINCGECGLFCRFNAILNTPKVNIIMKELCHNCLGCKLVCPVNAITYNKRAIGEVRSSSWLNKQPFVYGVLNTGEFSSTKVIQEVLKKEDTSRHKIIDAPPGSACAAVEAVEGADLALIVTEPTPFALSDMKMVVEMLENIQIKTCVFINKSGENEEELIDYCNSKKIKILGRLPLNINYGQLYAEGYILASEIPEVKIIFKKLWKNIIDEN
jgi:MinD superfamily P-loop ATPase